MNDPTWLGAWASVIGAVAAVGSLIATFLIYTWTRTVKPRWELRQVIAPGLVEGLTTGKREPIELWIENVGERTAVGAYALVDYPHIATRVEEPATGRRSIPPGGRLKLRSSFEVTSKPAGLKDNRPYIEGDDVYFDLSGLKVEVRWGTRGRKKQRLNNLHMEHMYVPVIDLRSAQEIEARG